jgi:hypothetical protein
VIDDGMGFVGGIAQPRRRVQQSGPNVDDLRIQGLQLRADVAQAEVDAFQQIHRGGAKVGRGGVDRARNLSCGFP